jgi:hypothetical protein
VFERVSKLRPGVGTSHGCGIQPTWTIWSSFLNASCCWPNPGPSITVGELTLSRRESADTSDPALGRPPSLGLFVRDAGDVPLGGAVRGC